VQQLISVERATAQDVAARWEAAMRSGDWEAAWRQTDRIELPRRARRQHPDFERAPYELRWDGTAFGGRRVLVRCEHGLGDTLQFIRYVPLVAALACEVNTLVQPQLLPLLAAAPGLGQVRNAWTDEPPPPHDVEIEVMELPYAFRSTPATVPPPYPHLAQRVLGKLDLAFPHDGKLRVGLLWAASQWNHSRSIEPTLLEPLLRAGRAQFYSIRAASALLPRPSSNWISSSRSTR
jgi:hypothetical protein